MKKPPRREIEKQLSEVRVQLQEREHEVTVLRRALEGTGPEALERLQANYKTTVANLEADVARLQSLVGDRDRELLEHKQAIRAVEASHRALEVKALWTLMQLVPKLR